MLARVVMRRARILAIGLAVALSASCGRSPALTMQILSARPTSLTVSVNNLSDASTAPLTLS